MAYDKIIVIHKRLDNRINYALNESKTEHSGLVLKTALNCELDSAYKEMNATKQRWDKSGGILGYHLIHSYALGEISPEEAHKLSVEFAKRLLGERFETVIGTHVDREHVHSHIVFNSVSFADGSRYRSDFKAYFGDIRGMSNEISRENGLSVIEPKNKGKHYAEWNTEKQGKPTVRGIIRKDIDAAIAQAISLQTFYAALEKQGYTIKRGANIKHTAVRPPGGSRFIRLDSLGESYTEEAIKQRIVEGDRPRTEIAIHRYKLKNGNIHKSRKLRGFQALYVHYLYYLGIWKPKAKKQPIPFAVRADVKRLNQYTRQFNLMRHYRIETAQQRNMLQDALQTEIESLMDRRKPLYKLQRKGEDVRPQIDQINRQLKRLRRELYTCRQIESTAPRIRESIELCKPDVREEIKTKERSYDLWR